jgi:hypothetical protein
VKGSSVEKAENSMVGGDSGSRGSGKGGDGEGGSGKGRDREGGGDSDYVSEDAPYSVEEATGITSGLRLGVSKTKTV